MAIVGLCVWNLVMQHLVSHKSTGPLRLLGSLAVGMLLCVVACASASPASDTGDHEAEVAIVSKVDAAIGQAPCSTDAQCRTIGVGANACGGPAAWRPWSTQTNGKGESLQSLADQLGVLQRRRQAQSGIVSTCRYIPDPGASCQAQRCVLKTAPNAAS